MTCAGRPGLVAEVLETLDLGVEKPDVADRRAEEQGVRLWPDSQVTAASPKVCLLSHGSDEGLADSDPWRGFCLAIEKVCELQARDRGFTAAFMSNFPHAVDFAADRKQALRSTAELIRRAKDSGRLRPDVVLDDLILVIMATAASRPPRPLHASRLRRFAALVIEGLRASPLPPLPPLSPLSPLPPVPRLQAQAGPVAGTDGSVGGPDN